MLVRGQQYKYRGHVVHFLREVGLVYNQFPLLPQELNIVLLRPVNTSSHANLSRQFTRQFRVRRQPVVIWLDYLRRHHPGYRCVVIDEERLNQLPQDGNVLDAIPQSQVEAADVGPEEDQEAEPDLEDEAAVPDLLAKDTELDALARRAFFTPPDLPLRRLQHANAQPLTREQLIQALEHSEDPEAQALINSIARHAVSIRGTRPFWNKKRQDLEAYAYNLGCPGAFITFSPADLHWRSLYQHMPQYDDWLAATEPERMALSRRLLRQNPHIAAFHFYRRYTLFRDIVLSKKFSITDYWDRYEWQGRGSPHNHGLYWMDNCPGADMEDEAARDVFARIWGFHVTAINPEPSRTMPQGEGNPLSVDPLSIEMTFLRLSQIVNRCQRHKCNTTYCLRVRKRTGDLARDMEGAAADIEAANVANPERECRFDFPRALRELAAVIRKEGRSYYVFEAARNDSLMNNFNPAIILGWLANIDISPCTSLQAVITYAAKYCSKSEKKTESFARLADQVLPHTSHVQPLLSFSSRLMNKLIAERDYSAQEISHLLLNIPLQEGTRMVVTVDCRPLERQARSYRVDGDVNEAIGSYRKYLERKDQHEDITYLEYLQSYNLNTWRLAAQAKKRVLSYFPRYKSMEASSQFNDFCRVKLMMVHPHRSPEELLVVGGQRFDSFTAAYMHCRQHHDTHADDHYGEPDTDELTAEEDEFELEIHEEPIAEEDWHELARMLPDRPLEEEDIDILGRRDIDINYDWTPHVGRYADDGILNSDYWKQRKAENTLDLDVDDQPLEARDSLNPEQRIVYDTVMGHFLTQDPSQLLLHVDGGGGTGKSYLINLLSAHLQSATGGRGTPVWRAAPTGVAGNQISGTTLHSLLHLPINKDFKPLSPVDKTQLQKKLKDIKYLIIDEKSMLGLRQLSWIDDRLREAFPNRNEEFFGGLNILLVGDFFQLPPVLQKPLYCDKEVQGVEIKGRNAYRRFDKSVFLKVVQRQRGDDQEAFRTALGELRLLQLSMESWKLLSTRVQAKLDDREVARFSSALRVYATKDRVNEYNHYHLDRLGRPVVQVKAKNVGPGAAAAPDDKAGNLAKQIPICIGARLMLTSNLWQPVGLCNGARGTVYDIGWAPEADPIQDPPCVIMMEFDKYNGPVFLTTPDGKKIVPILPVERDFLIGATLCARTQFPLIVCYAITVHKSQSITEDMIVTDLSCRYFQTGLSYVAVSRVKTLEGLMLDAPFDRNHLVYGSPPDGMKMKMRDQELRKRQVLTRSPYMIYNTKNGHGTGSVRR
ncbi:ATP-dependent DNA helicase pif1 [Fusarium oxysporum f. sp. rapae]|uniref:ATP-dependent DNA helicase n=1 Tax=Fusarium oxysporum f. sp. rapae TaxID=485398 RepID=A0A8J5NFW0_FUSOX|nr:ATP-dependent DNA helicase pif1 [Fusarium oxysporum f. sp. rapae]